VHSWGSWLGSACSIGHVCFAFFPLYLFLYSNFLKVICALVQEADINEYFKPIDKEVEAIINMQMEKEKAKTEMMGAMYKQAMLEKAAAEATAEVDSANKAKMEMMGAMFKQALLEKAQVEATAAQTKNTHNQT